MPRKMPPAVERALLGLLGWRNGAAAPVDYMAIRYETVEGLPAPFAGDLHKIV